MGGIPIPHLADGRYPILPDGGYPLPRSGQGGTPSQVRMGIHLPRLGWGILWGTLQSGLDGGTLTIETGWGYSHWDWMGYPPPSGMDRVTPIRTRWGTPIKTGWGNPPSRLVGGNPPPPHWEIRRQSSYVAGSIPLVDPVAF